MRTLILLFIAVAAFSQEKTLGTLNVRDFGRTAADGTTDDTSTVAACIQQARMIGGYCVFPPGDYRVTRTIKITANPLTAKAADVSVIGISGTGHGVYQGTRTGSRIICAMKDGSPCLDIDLTSYSKLTIYLSQLYFVGPDSSPAGAVSGEAVNIHTGAAGSVPRVIVEDLGFSGFYGPGKYAFSAEGLEGAVLRDVFCSFNSGCFHGFRAFNGNSVENIYVQQSSGPKAVLIEDADTLTWTGGIMQSNAGTALHLHGVRASSFRGTHFECDNIGYPVDCTKPKPKPGLGAIVMETSRGATNTNQYDTFESLVMNGPGDKVIAYSSDGAGASTFATFLNFYNASVVSPKFVFDSSASHFEGHGVAGPGQYADSGKDNIFCVGSACSGGTSGEEPATSLGGESIECHDGKSLRSVKLQPGGRLSGICR